MALANFWSKFVDSLNFFRIHVLFFTFTPLIFSGIFYAANGATHIPYIDALFVCFSAGTVCGLATIDLSSLTGFQQAILFVQAAIGSPVVVSWVMVYIRRQYFNKKLQYIVEAEIAARKARAEERALEAAQNGDGAKLMRRLTRAFTTHPSLHGSEGSENGGNNEKGGRRVRPDAIRRTSAAPHRVNPNGDIADVVPENLPVSEPAPILETIPENENEVSASPSKASTLRNDKPPVGIDVKPDSSDGVGVPLEKTQTVTFNDRVARLSEGRTSGAESGYFGLRVNSPSMASSFRPSADVVHDDRTYVPPGGIPRRRTTMRQRSMSARPGQEATSIHEQQPEPIVPAAKNTGYGGFPYPTTLLYNLFKMIQPSLRRAFGRTTTLLAERTRSLRSHNTRQSEKDDSYGAMTRNTVKYFSDSFNALIGRNSKFYDLTEDNLEELGGVEYRALNSLLWLIATYHFMTQLLSFTIIAPYMSLPRWRPAFTTPNLHQDVNPVWYSAFQVVSAYTTLGMSLVDQSVVPFQQAYPLIFVCTFLIMAGNLAYPIFLRFFIWSIMKFTPGTHLHETLGFLLDHPRRCYIYLFPSKQTWLLLAVVMFLNAVDWFAFLVLNIGESVYEAIPLGVRFAIGILQATAVRAAGFATMSISAMAPALQVLFVIVMYLGVYPIALSVQATNVYEEKSLGVFEEEEEETEEAEPDVEESQPSSYGKYIAWHARKQLAFDMWWLVMAVFLLCIIERGKIHDKDNFEWFTIFAILFEIISAYSGVGMSLGVPYANFSFSGAFTPLSKIITIAVMLRGRHRGLPVAIDRAVMLPFEFKKARTAQDGGQEGADAQEVVVDGDGMSVINRIIDEDGSVRKKSR